MRGIIYRALSPDELPLNLNEVANRLGTERGYTDENIERCLLELKKAAAPKFSAVRVPVIYGEDFLLDLGFGEFRSVYLTKNLKESPEAFIFAATLGSGVDRLLKKLSLTSQSAYFITDALASAMAEALADYTDKYLREGIACRPRFSPGFGDLSLELQPDILASVNAYKLLGMTVNKSFLMAPMKSVTAVMGIVGSAGMTGKQLTV